MRAIAIDEHNYPLKGWQVVSQSDTLERQQSDWAEMGETLRKSGKGYNFAKGFDTTMKGALRLSPHYKALNNTSLTTGYGYFVEDLGASQTATLDSTNKSSSAGANTASGGKYLYTHAHTVAAGENRILVVDLSFDYGTLNFMSTTTVTYAELTMTYLGHGRITTGGTGNNGFTVARFFLKNPPVGTANVVVTTASSHSIALRAYVFTGVNLESPWRTTIAATGTSTAPSVAIASATNDIVLDALASGRDVGGGALTATDDVPDEIGNVARTVSGDVYIRGASSKEAGAASVTTSWTLSTSSAWVILSSSLKPVADEILVYCLDAGNAFELTYDSDAGITLENTQAISGGTPGRPAYFIGKWYVPMGTGAAAYRLDSPGTGTRWVSAVYKAAHHCTFQQGVTPRIVKADETATNEIDLCTVAPDAEADWAADDFPIGDTSTDITDLLEAIGELLVAKEDNLYQMSQEGTSIPLLTARSRGRADPDNGKGMYALHDEIFYPTKDALFRYVMNSEIAPAGVESMRGFHDTPTISSPKTWRHSGGCIAGSYRYELLNSETESILLQGRLRGEDDPPGDRWVYNTVLCVPLCKGPPFCDSQMRLWLKGASVSEADRDIRVIELDDNGGLEKPLRRGQASATHEIWLSGDDFDRPFDLKQLSKVPIRTSNWPTGASLQVSVYRDNNTEENVGSAITSSTLTEVEWAAGTSDTAYVSWLKLTLTTDATYDPVISDPRIEVIGHVARTPTVYQIDIHATPETIGGDSLDPMSALEALRRLVGGAKVNVQDTSRENTTFSGEVLAVQEKMIGDDDQAGYDISVFVRRWDVT